MKKWLVWILLALLAAALSCSSRQPPDEQRTLATLRQVDDHPLYVMTYYGDYGFAEFLKHGWRAPQRRLDAFGRGTRSAQAALPQGDAVPAWACTCFAALNPQGTPWFGRNFDWELHPALLLFTDPPDGYASVSMVDAAYLGLGSEPPSPADQRKLLDAPYWPFDGVNECGVAMGLMAVPAAEASRDPAKVTIGSLHAVRLVLDQAKDVEQALMLLGQYNIDFGDGPPLHYLLADRGGASAVVEFVRSEMRVLRNRDAWQVATNFLLSEVGAAAPDDLGARYREANATLTRTAGRLSSEEAMALLGRVSQPITRWSTLYDLRTGAVRVAMGRSYERVHAFELGMR